MSLPKTFKAAAYEEIGGKLKLVERPLEKPKDGEILVKVLACGICHSDYGIKFGFASLPRVPGHELIGDVVAVGPNVRRWTVGDRVGCGWHGGHCGECTSCTSGDFVTCKSKGILGVFADGGYAEYVILRTEAVSSIPKDIDPAEAAPLLCAGVTCYNSLRHMHNLHPGDIVAVQGIGGLGHLGIQFARSMGFKTVALSSSDTKRSLAMSLGAHEYIDSSKVNAAEALQQMGGAKVVICTAPSGEAIQQLIPCFAPDGILLVVAIAENVTIPNTVMLIPKRISIVGWTSGQAKDIEDTIAFAQLQDIHCRIEKFKLEDVEKAHEKMLANKINFRGVIVFD